LHRHWLLIIAAVKDANGRLLAYFDFEDEPQPQISRKRLSRDERSLSR
jgi:hypothetical protein